MDRPIYHARVERLFDHCAGTRSLFLRMVSPQRLPLYAPGMFVSLNIPLSNEVRVRPYTIASSPEDCEPFELVFDLVPHGDGSAWMFERRVGDLLDFTGPFGTFTLGQVPEGELVFIAEGTAIAPIRPMIRRAISHQSASPIHLLYAAQSSGHLLYHAELESLAKTCTRFRCEPLIVEHALLYERLLDEVRRRWAADPGGGTRHFFICGIGAGVLKLRDLLRQAGYDRRAVRYERW